jgi:hypothetical protein
MRKFWIALLGLVVLLIIVDRAGVFIAEREVGTRVQSAYDLPSRPHVTIRGIPFLTQVISGNYQEIDVSISAATVSGVQLHNIDARFTGVNASLSLLLGQNSGSVTAANAIGTAVIPYAQIQSRLPWRVRIGPDGSGLNVSGTTPYGVIKATARLGVTSSGITVTPQHLTLGGLSAGALGALASKLTLTIPVGTLPMHLSITGVRVTQGGVLVDASAHDVRFASG